MKKILLFGVICSLFLGACTTNEIGEVDGKKPVYISSDNYADIKSEAAKPFTQVGKIFKIGHRIFISDVNSGVHVINNATPSAPSKEAFIKIFGNNDMAVKDNIMYADNGDDLVAIDISDLSNVKVEKRLEDVYQFNTSMFPVGHFGYFECVDVEKGIAYDWVDAKLVNPKCDR